MYWYTCCLGFIHPRAMGREGVSDEFGSNGNIKEIGSRIRNICTFYLYIDWHLRCFLQGRFTPFNTCLQILPIFQGQATLLGSHFLSPASPWSRLSSVALVVHLRSLLASVAITYQTRIRFEGRRCGRVFREFAWADTNMWLPHLVASRFKQMPLYGKRMEKEGWFFD